MEVKVVIEGTPEEIAALVRATQERQDAEVEKPIETMVQAVRQAIGDIAGASQDSSLPSSGT